MSSTTSKGKGGAQAPPGPPEPSIAEQDEALSAKDKGAQRWRCVEVFNALPGLKAGTRQIGIALVSAMNAKTQACFPSHERLATMTDLSLSSVDRAKKELRRRRLIDWYNPHGRRGVCRYRFNWVRIIALHRQLHEHLRQEGEARRREREADHVPPDFDDEDDSQYVMGDTINPSEGPPFNMSPAESYMSSVPFQHVMGDVSIVSPMTQELSKELAHRDMAQHSTMNRTASRPGAEPLDRASERGGLGGEAAAPEQRSDVGTLQAGQAQPSAAPPPASAPPPSGQAGQGALKGKPIPPPPPRLIFPTLTAAWEGDPAMMALLARLTTDQQYAASTKLATKGEAEARAYVLKVTAPKPPPPPRFPALTAAFADEPDVLARIDAASFDVLDAASRALGRGGKSVAAAILNFDPPTLGEDP